MVRMKRHVLGIEPGWERGGESARWGIKEETVNWSPTLGQISLSASSFSSSFFQLNFKFDLICNKLMSMSAFPSLHLEGSWVVAASTAYPDNSRGWRSPPGERGGVVMIKGLETYLWFKETKIIFKAAGLKFRSSKVSKWGSLWWSGIRQVLMVMTAIIALPRGHQHPCWEVSPTQDVRFRKLIWGRSSSSWLFLVYQVGGQIQLVMVVD